jgi:hypothetical protein
MSIELSIKDKIVIVEQHLRNQILNEYNLTLSLQELNALPIKNTGQIESYQSQLNDIAAQKAVLQSELDSLNAQLPVTTN